MKPMKKGMKDNIERKQPSINDVKMYKGFPLFSFLELNINLTIILIHHNI